MALKSQKNNNLRRMSSFLLEFANTEHDILKEAEDRSVLLKLEVSLDRYSSTLSLWECGGSVGKEGCCIAILDDRMHTRIPIVVAKPGNKYNHNQAMIAIHPGFHILGAIYGDGNPYVVGMFRVHEFEYDEEKKKNYVSLSLVHISTYPVKDQIKPYLIDIDADADAADEYVRDTHTWAHPATIVLPKVTDYMAMYPLLIKHWHKVVLKDSDVDILQNLNQDISHKPMLNISAFYEALRKDAHYLRNRFNVRPGLLISIENKGPDCICISGRLVKRDSKQVKVFKEFNNDVIEIKTLYLDPTKLKNFWLPDMDPWYNSGLQKLKHILKAQDTAKGNSALLSKYHLYGFVG